jgi:PKD repeat protein
MKTLIRIMSCLLLLSVGYMASAQCISTFSAFVQSGGTVIFYTHDSMSVGSTHHWDFGDGATSSDTGNYFVYHYSASGKYNVCLTVSNTAQACSTTWCDSVEINLCANSTQFNITQTGFGDYQFSPTTLGSITGANYSWDFGDGATSQLLTPTHQYTANGSYTVKLRMSDAQNTCADSTYGYPQVVLCDYNGTAIYLDSLNIGPSRIFGVYQPHPGYNYSWSFDDGGTGTGDTTSHAFTVSGTHNICVLVSDAATGCKDTVCNNLYIDRCGVNNVYLHVSSSGNTASFNVTVYPVTGVTIGYNWSFPNGTPSSSTDAAPTTVYSQLGAQSACVILDLQGCLDTICQNFTLTPEVHNVTGRVWEGGSPACAVVYLIKQDTIGHLVLVDSVLTNDSLSSCDGLYGFYNLPVDTYYVKAAPKTSDPHYADYLPTYFQNSLTWGNAFSFGLISGSASGFDIYLIAGNNPGGPGFIGGWVSQGAGLTAAGGPADTHRSTDNAGDPLPGVQINLVTDADAAVAYTYTDAQGHYKFNNIALGSYKVYAEQLNKVPSPIPVTLTAENPTAQNVDVSINSNSAVAGVNDLTSVELSRVYPNPVISMLELQLTAKRPADVSVKLNDMLGRMVQEQTTRLSSGTNSMSLDMETLPAGVYQLTVQTGNKHITYKVVKAK